MMHMICKNVGILNFLLSVFKRPYKNDPPKKSLENHFLPQLPQVCESDSGLLLVYKLFCYMKSIAEANSSTMAAKSPKLAFETWNYERP